MEQLIEKAARGLLDSEYAIALTGAGMSTESGIPDFRGPDGVWTKHPEAEIQAYEHYGELLRDPKAHWERILQPESVFGELARFGEYPPNPGHYALAELEKLGILKILITQNVDGLHQKAGSQNVIEYHGSMVKLRCMSCGSRFDRREFDLERLRREGELPPRCVSCKGVLKYDGVYFREPIPSDVAHRSVEEAWKCDLMLICGTSAVVFPFAQLPRTARERKTDRERKTETGLYTVERIPTLTIIEVNGEPTPLTEQKISDYLIQGRTGEILPKMVEEVERIRH
ncbi:NAD-dependent deacetylase [Chloroflexota bacterium]